MTRFTPLRSLSLLLGMGLAVAAGTAGMAKSDTDAVQCSTIEHTQHGMRTIEGTILSPRPVAGEYRFAVKSSSHGNSSTINQGGAFSVPANEAVSIGQVQINSAARYSADFSITLGGQTIACLATSGHVT